MAIARKHLVDPDRSGCYHVISRCVRRAFLCGDELHGGLKRRGEHRRDWIALAVDQASQCFAVEVLSFAIMSNHLHLVVKTQPQRALNWSDQEVAERWAALYPLRGDGDDSDDKFVPWPPELIAKLAGDSMKCAALRQRLVSLSWMMKIIKERIAKRANQEDQCRGHFWEQRFQSIKLLDQPALLSCMAYVDLNPIRAKMADRPETSAYTSVLERIRARQTHLRALGLANGPNGLTTKPTDHTSTSEQASPATAPLTPALQAALNGGPEHGLWIAPMANCIIGTSDCIDSPRPIRLDNYLDLVDATGRIIREDKRGAIPKHLLPILERLELDVDSWLTLMRSHGRFIGSAIGHYTARVAEAARRGIRWIRNTLPEVFSGRPPPGPRVLTS